MKTFWTLILLFNFATWVHSQTVTFSGTVYDYNGDVVVGAKVIATAESSKETQSTSSSMEGKFMLDLKPGLYSLEIAGVGLLTIKYPEYLIVNSSTGMKMDLVMFGARFHEPCGVSGANCLPARMLRREFTIKYSPELKQIRKDFSDLNQEKQNK